MRLTREPVKSSEGHCGKATSNTIGLLFMTMFGDAWWLMASFTLSGAVRIGMLIGGAPCVAALIGGILAVQRQAVSADEPGLDYMASRQRSFGLINVA